MKKIFLGVVVLFSMCAVSIAYAQPYSQKKFLRYETFKNSIQNGEAIESLSKRFDLVWMLYLDSTYAKLITEQDKNIEPYEYSHNFNNSKPFFTLKTKSTRVEDIFTDAKQIKQIKELINPNSKIEDILSFPIYLKGNNLGVAQFYGPTTTETYYFSLKNGELQGYRAEIVFEHPIDDDF